MQLLLGALATAVTVSAQCQVYDYVIVGGGTCGLLLANRLSADPKTTVAVVEPGGDVRNNTNVTTITAWLNNLGTSIDWQYESVLQPGAGNRTLTYHAGKAIGGTSTINGMTYIRADAAEIDAWSALGNDNWTWDALLPYYKRVEAFSPPTPSQVAAGATYDPAYHGTTGELKVGFLPELQSGSFHDIAAQTWATLGFQQIRDVNGGKTRGFDVWPMTVDWAEDVREDAARAFYWPVEGRENLVVIPGTARRVVWQDGEADADRDGGLVATGVEYLDQSDSVVVVNAMREVILSAGAWRTPPILEYSGIGNPSLLGNLGIDVKIDLPGVGENLVDQPNSGLIYLGAINATGYVPYATFATADDLFGINVSTIAAETAASIPHWASQAASRTGGAISAKNIETIMRIQHDLIFSKNITIAEILTLASGNALVSAFWDLFPFSRGSVHLASTAAASIDSPVIDPAFFAVDFDLTTQVSIGRLAQTSWNTAPANALVIENFSPGSSVLPDPATDAQWESFITGAFSPNYHPVGSAAMMSRDLGGVVNPRFLVYGAKNVRVVDASVIPLQVSGHLTSTLYAVAERAAEFILAAAGHNH